MFTIGRNPCSGFTGTGVHDRAEPVFTIGRNAHFDYCRAADPAFGSTKTPTGNAWKSIRAATDGLTVTGFCWATAAITPVPMGVLANR